MIQKSENTGYRGGGRKILSRAGAVNGWAEGEEGDEKEGP